MPVTSQAEKKIRQSSVRAVCAAMVIGATAGWAGCSALDLGPEPDAYVGPGRVERAQPPTDAQLRAVVPRVAGDEAGGGAEMPGAATGPATAPASRPPLPENLSVQDAILAGLENNLSLRVQRHNVPIARTNEETARAAFDPTLSGTAQGGRTVTGGVPVDSINASGSVSEFLPTGTNVQGQVTTSNSFYSDAASSTGANMTVTQSILRGAGLDVNLASLREAEVATKVSQYQLRGVAESLVANVEETYWDLTFAELQMDIVRNALEVAQKQLDDTQTRVRVQRLSPSELPAAQAEVAARQEDLINAESSRDTLKLKFLQLLTPASRSFWDRPFSLSTMPFIPVGTMDAVDSHVEVALKLRPDMNEAKLELQRGDLEIVRTKNGLLPRLDLFVTLGKTGFATSFGESAVHAVNGSDYEAMVGVSGDISPINRAARASYHAAQMTKDQLQDTLDNQAQLVQLDVRTQYIEVMRSRAQIDATTKTREAQEATMNVQQGKLAAGSGTSLDLAIAHRDLLTAQLAEVQAKTNHLKALVELYRLEGTLLMRRGLDAPGAATIDGTAWRK